MSMVIRGLGTAVPPVGISQESAAEHARLLNGRTDEQRRLIKTLYRRSGVKHRHSVILDQPDAEQLQSFLPAPADAEDRGPDLATRMRRYEQDAAPLAVRAADQALGESGFAPDSITHLVTVSCTGFSAPGVDVALMQKLRLLAGVERTHIGFMGCHGTLNGLRVANAFVRSEPRACVLVCAIELCSLHYRYGWDPEQVVGNALFADGAAAVVGSAETEGDSHHWRLVATGSCLLSNSTDAMRWRIGNHGFEMTLTSQVPNLISDHLHNWMDDWLREQELTIAQVPTWAVHPGGPRILSAVEQALELDPATLAVSRGVLSDYGNMSSPTILFIIDRLRREQAPAPCVALGFGPGLTVEACLFR